MIKKNKKIQWKLIFQILVFTIFLFGIESLSYFGIAVWFGKIAGTDNTLNLQTYIDKIMPWCTPLYAIYIPWPFIWFVVIPVVIYFSSGKKSYWQYIVNSILMYTIGSLIYALIPTTCTPKDFIGTNGWDNQFNSLFHNELSNLANDSKNIWGSCPSYHNYWASLFILFAFKKNVKSYFRYPMITIGVLISLSTLMLHQHNIPDVIVTYSMTGMFLLIDKQFLLSTKLETISNKIFNIIK